MVLYQYFKQLYRSLPDLEGPLSETLLSAYIKAANDAVLAASKQWKKIGCPLYLGSELDD